MSGRGKGGKGLGKGGAKRHRKVLRDNIQGELLCCRVHGPSCSVVPVLPLLCARQLSGSWAVLDGTHQQQADCLLVHTSFNLLSVSGSPQERQS